MKVLTKLFLLLISLTLIHWHVEAQAKKVQCLPEKISSDCILTLNSDYNYVKSFPITKTSNKKEIEYSYIFAKGISYIVKVCSNIKNSTDGVVISLLDQRKKVLASSKTNNNFFSTIVYPCRSTSLYYIRFSFDEKSKNYCAGAVLGFKR